MGSVEGEKDSGNCENEGGIVNPNPILLTMGNVPKRSYPKSKSSITTGPQRGPAQEEKIGRRFFLDTVKAEQREKFI